jgi:hypothetical protein
MKKILYALLMIVLVTSCKKNEVRNEVEHIPDHELFNEAKDIEAASKRRKPKLPRPVQPVDTTVQEYQTVLYIDFDGQVVSGTYWNTSGAITCLSSGLSETQKQIVVNKVAGYYSVFPGVKITMNEAEFNAAPIDKRMRCIVTTSWQWYGAYVGGVAYVNSYTWADDTPCFVFSGNYGYSTTYIGDAVSHEFGHTLSLRHQSLYDEACNKIDEYYPGKIMGRTVSENSVWSIGANSTGCNTIQNDIEQIKSKL